MSLISLSLHRCVMSKTSVLYLILFIMNSFNIEIFCDSRLSLKYANRSLSTSTSNQNDIYEKCLFMMTSSNGIIFRVTDPLHRGQWRGDLMFPLICALNKRINGWVNNREAGDLRRHRTHYDAIVMLSKLHWREVLITIPCCEFPRSQDITRLSVNSVHRNPLSRMFTNLIF